MFRATIAALLGTALLSGPANGTWTLRVGDDAGSDSGTLDAWSLALCIAP